MHLSDQEQDSSDISDSNDEQPESSPESLPKKAQKRIKYENIADGPIPPKKGKNDLYKAPTVEELNELKETQNLYNNNLFRLQIGELINEVKLKQKHVNAFATWYKKFEVFIAELPDYESSKLASSTKCDQTIETTFSKPECGHIYGLHKLGALPGPVLTVNINLVMPRSTFHVKDYLNNRYFAKRDHYLAYISHFLRKELAESVRLEIEGDFLPVLLCTIKSSSKVQVRIVATPCANYFRAARFHPDAGNVKANYLEVEGVDEAALRASPTPFYNAALGRDVTLAANHARLEAALAGLATACEAIKLIRVWLGQRRLLCFTDDLILYFLAYLAGKKTINKHMSSYQVVRTFWGFVKDADLRAAPIALSEDVKDFASHQRRYELVFLDFTGCFNVLSFVTTNLFDKIRGECAIALKLLDDNGLNGFQSLFITSLQPHLQFDLVLSVSASNFAKIVVDPNRAQFYGFSDLQRAERVAGLLKRALNKRARCILPVRADGGLRVGVNLDAAHAFAFLELGPALNDPLEAEFRAFWGGLASDRRFKDGSICVAVYFETKTIKERRGVVAKIVDFVIGTKLGLAYNLLYDGFEEVIVNKNVACPFSVGTNEECSLRVMQAADGLGKKLRALEMPLTITGVQGVGDLFAFCDVFPPIADNYAIGREAGQQDEHCFVLRHGLKKAPRFVAPIECVLHLEHSSKWPKELNGVRNMIVAFYLEIAKVLKEKHGIVASVKKDFIDVFYAGFVFRYRVYLAREIGLLKKEANESGVVVYKESDESREMEEKLVILPKVISALKGIQAQHPSFGPSTALIKRWLRSHLIDDFHFPNIAVNLLNASLYTNQTPFLAPLTPQIGFLRFLKFIADFQHQIQPVIVNFNEEISKEQLAEIDAKIAKARDACPHLFLAQPYDGCESVFTRAHPSKEILRRVRQLAAGTLRCLDVALANNTRIDVRGLFAPNFDGYNVLIHLKPELNALRHERLSGAHMAKFEEFEAGKNSKIPVTGFNPIRMYLDELRRFYADFASFFHDCHGGDVIGVLWKPKTNEVDDFKVTKVGGKKLRKGKLVTNFDAIIEDFYLLGKDLVRSIDKK